MVEQHIKDLISAKVPCTIGDLPSAPVDHVAIVLFNGTENMEYFSFGTVFTPVVKLVVRNQSYETAQQWCETLKTTLHRHHDDYFISIMMQGYPTYLGRDAHKIHEFQLVFNIKVKE